MTRPPPGTYLASTTSRSRPSLTQGPGGFRHAGGIYPPADRPLIEVLIDGQWWPGELRAWFSNDDGTWRANVGYSTGPGENRLATVPAEAVRQAP